MVNMPKERKTYWLVEWGGRMGCWLACARCASVAGAELHHSPYMHSDALVLAGGDWRWERQPHEQPTVVTGQEPLASGTADGGSCADGWHMP